MAQTLNAAPNDVRLRQVVIAARDRDAVVTELCEALDVEVCFEDPAVAEFGLVNALLAVGDQFIEVVSPVTASAPAARWLDRNGADGGYMAIFQFHDLDAARARAADVGARTVWHLDLPHVRATHLHPKDMGGAIVSLDWADPPASWPAAGPHWERYVHTAAVDAIVGVEVAGADEQRWRYVLGPEMPEGTVAFTHGPDRIRALTIHASDRDRAEQRLHIGGVQLRLV